LATFKKGELCSLVDGSVVIILDDNVKTVNYGTDTKRYIKVSSLCDKMINSNHIDVTFLVKIPQE
tara:strand:- start:110 stop:304 length:195 start_codon:yes stop_codon:yes gene_type:complete